MLYPKCFSHLSDIYVLFFLSVRHELAIFCPNRVVTDVRIAIINVHEYHFEVISIHFVSPIQRKEK